MNYKRIYNELISNALERNIEDGVYYEKHHIVPRSLGGTDDAINLVCLTAREHFVAHWLLWKFSEGRDKYKMGHAFFRMCYHNSDNRKIKLKPRDYQYAREAHRESARYFHTGKKLSEEQRKRRKTHNPNARKCIIEGKEFNAISLAAEYYGVTSAKVRRYLDGDGTLEWLKGETRYANKEIENKVYINNTNNGRNHKITEDGRKRVIESNKNRKCSEETRRKIGEKTAKNTYIVHPDTKDIIIVRGRKSWCEDNGYSKSMLHNIVNSENPIHKGEYIGYYVYSEEEYENKKD
jgi:hypothetical protein